MVTVEEQDKIRMTRIGANKLFEVDRDIRKKMTYRELIELFDKIWWNGLKSEIVNAKVISPEEVRRPLLNVNKPFLDSGQEHRSFYHLGEEFIAQLKQVENSDYKLNQLWRVAWSDSPPKTLYITFSSVEERNRFTSLAEGLGTEDEALGLRLIQNFMDLHPSDRYNNE